MSISTVVTRGFGTFGTVNFLPTLGYGDFSPSPVVTTVYEGRRPARRNLQLIRRKREEDELCTILPIILELIDRD